MLTRAHSQCLITPSDLPSSQEGLQVIGTFNPGCAAFGDDRTAVLVRVSESPIEQREGQVSLPYYNSVGDLSVDWVDKQILDTRDPRLVIFNDTGFKRLTFTTHLRVVWVDADYQWTVGGLMTAAGEDEAYGIEDPRITKIGETYYITYVAVSRHGAVTKLAKTEDFVTFERLGIIFCRENKDVVLFPDRIEGEYVAIHRPTGTFATSPAEMWLARSGDLQYWGRHAPLWGGRSIWDGARVGGGVPPIRTDRGWLVIYHGRAPEGRGEVIGAYTAGAILLDLKDPNRVIAHTPEPFLVPSEPYETEGFVDNVVFPTGHVMRNRQLILYCGASDTYVSVVEYDMAEVMNCLVDL